MIFHWWLFWKPIFHCLSLTTLWCILESLDSQTLHSIFHSTSSWFCTLVWKSKKEKNLNLNSLKNLQKLTFKIRTWYVVFLIVEPPVLCFHIYSWVTFSAKPDQETVLQRPKEREEERAKLRRLQNLRSKDAGEQTGDEAEAATTGEEDYKAASTCSSL